MKEELVQMVRKLKKENEKRSDAMSSGTLSDYNHTVDVYLYNYTLDITKQLETIVSKSS